LETSEKLEKIFRQEVLRLGQQAALVAFDKEHKITSAFLHDGASRLDLGVQGVHGDGAQVARLEIARRSRETARRAA